jgi:hypothetical protein
MQPASPITRIARPALVRAHSSAAAAARDPGAHLRKPPAREPAYLPTAPVLEGGRERSAIFGAYPTRKQVNFAARRSKAADASWRQDPVGELGTRR